MTRFRKELVRIGAVVLLSLLSAIIVIDNAGAEPYVTFNHADAIIQIGGACVLLVLWVQFVIWLIVGIIRNKISFMWAPVLIWAFIACLYVSHCPVAYAQDITKFVIERH
jgi:hypothetical protein